MGAVSAVLVGAAAVGAVTVGVPVAVVTGVLGGLAVVGATALGLDISEESGAGNWAGVAYDVGSFIGGVVVGGISGGWIANGIRAPASGGWSWSSNVAMRYRPSLGSFGEWLGTGPTAASGGVAAGLAGGGAAIPAKGGC